MLNLKSFAVALVVALIAFAEVGAKPAPVIRSAPLTRDTLVLWAMDEGINSGSTLRKITRRFAHRSGYPVKVRFLDWGTAFEQLTRTLATDAASAESSGIEFPDVIQLGSSWVPHFASHDLIASVPESLLVSLDTTRFYAEAMKVSHLGSDAETYSLPWFLDVRGLLVNKRLWQELELTEDDASTYPKFYGTLRAISKKKLKNKVGASVAPFGYGVKNDWTGHQQMSPIIWSFGGDLVVKEGDSYRSALADSSTLNGLRHYLKFLNDLDISPYGFQENSTQNADRFVRSEQLVIYGTAEFIRKLEFSADQGGLKESLLAEDSLAFISFPEGPNGRFTFVGGSHLALPKRGSLQKRNAAEALFVYLLRADNMDFFSRQIGFLPADKAMINIWAKDSRYGHLIENLEKNGRSFPNIPEWSGVEYAIITMVNAFAKNIENRTADVNEITVDAVLKAHQRINEILKYNENASPVEVRNRIEGILITPVDEESSFVQNDSAPEEGMSSSLVVVLGLVLVCLALIAFVGFAVIRRKR